MEQDDQVDDDNRTSPTVVGVLREHDRSTRVYRVLHGIAVGSFDNRFGEFRMPLVDSEIIRTKYPLPSAVH